VRLPSDGAGWLNGERVPLDQLKIPVTDPAFHVGLGVFETIALRGGRLIDLEQHLDRLTSGAERLRIELPTRDRMRDVVARAANEERASHAWVKILATRGANWLVMTGQADPAEEGRAQTAVVLPWRRNPDDPLHGVKSISYAQNELGLEEARRRGADEGLWLNTRGHLTEACTANLFVVHRRRVFTAAPREGLLPGVTRDIALRAVREIGLPIHEGRLRLKRLFAADEAFLTSSLCGVRGLLAVDGRPIGRGVPGPVTREVSHRVAIMRGLRTEPVGEQE